MVSVISDSKQLVTFLFFGVLLLNCFTGFGSYAKNLDPEEVEVLRQISSKIKNSPLNISKTFCPEGFNFKNNSTGVEINVTCNCPDLQNGTVDRITIIRLKSLNLNGDLLPVFRKLTCLQELDLTRNYISGSIPPSFGQLPLLILSLSVNRLSGAIPKEIGDIASLQELVLEDNQLNGTLHENLGNLSNLSRLVLSGTNCSGRIPKSFRNLKNLTQFRISGTRISGKIPDFIGNWTKLERLEIQGTSMEGPIPSNMSLWKNLIQLMISDLKGTTTTGFPHLPKKLKYLVLRNCSMIASIPETIGETNSDLKRLDLSFNRLSGSIPTTIRDLNLNFMFLNNNSLSGEAPYWILVERQNNWDISYNNFNSGSSDVRCDQQYV